MTERPAFRVAVAETAEDQAKCMDIRKKVFVDEQGYDIRIETNQDDERSTHFLLRNDVGEPIGTARVINDNGQLGRFAVLKEYRGLGLGRPLIEAVHQHVRAMGGAKVWCQSQAGNPAEGGVDATGFYRRLGYVDLGEQYVKEGTVHQDMVFNLPPT